MQANEFQIGGKHYKIPYEHWDMVIDSDMPYVLGCATKYVSRWRDKNGVEDLKKSLHYIQKADENNIYLMKTNWLGRYRNKELEKLDYVRKFSSQLNPKDGFLINTIANGLYSKVITIIQDMIEEIENGPNSHYIRG